MYITNKNHGIHTVYYYEHVFSWQPRFQYNRESREFDSYPYQAIFRLPQAETSQHNTAKKVQHHQKQKTYYVQFRRF
jgi:hypothetical protein